jgi:hypothetical protein
VERAYFIALLLTIAVEVPTVAAFFPGQRRLMAFACLIATSFTHVLLFRVLAFLTLTPAGLVAGETFALVAEAAVYALASRPRNLPRAVMASAVANGLSFAASLLVPARLVLG